MGSTTAIMWLLQSFVFELLLCLPYFRTLWFAQFLQALFPRQEMRPGRRQLGFHWLLISRARQHVCLSIEQQAVRTWLIWLRWIILREPDESLWAVAAEIGDTVEQMKCLRFWWIPNWKVSWSLTVSYRARQVWNDEHLKWRFKYADLIMSWSDPKMKRIEVWFFLQHVLCTNDVTSTGWLADYWRGGTMWWVGWTPNFDHQAFPLSQTSENQEIHGVPGKAHNLFKTTLACELRTIDCSTKNSEDQAL